MNTFQPDSHYYHNQLLKESLKNFFGDFDDEVFDEFEHQLKWLELKGGETLMEEGEEGDSLYFVLSGRMVATRSKGTGGAVKIGEVVRGETVGEMAMFTNEPRHATISAIRDCVLVQLSKESFEELLAKYPQVALNFTRLIIERFKNTNLAKKLHHSVNLCLLPLHDLASSSATAKNIFKYLNARVPSCFLDKEAVMAQGFGTAETLEEEQSKSLTQWLSNLEAQHEYLFFQAEKEDTWWTQKCLREADHIVILVDASQSYDLQAVEQVINKLADVKVSLALVHPEDTVMPQHTEQWLEKRPFVSQHFHLKKNDQESVNRMTRIISGRANGLVLAGGGAKGFAHLGVFKALKEYNIPIDYLGGTSVGALMAATIAFNEPADKSLAIIKSAIRHKPSSDVSFFPFISIIKGQNIKRMVYDTVQQFCHREEVDLADTWLPMYAVASNFSKNRAGTFFRGHLPKILLASSAIPGIYPPIIINGDIYVDGGTFNNFPADVMRNLKINKVFGVDFVIDKTRELTMEEMPTNLDVLKSKITGKRSPKLKVPKIASIMLNSTLLYSSAKRQEVKRMLDVHFNPNVSKFKLTGWNNFDKIVEAGYRHAKETLENMSKEELNDLRDLPR